MTPKTSTPTSVHRFLGQRPRRRLVAAAAVAVLAIAGTVVALTGAFSGQPGATLSLQDASRSEESTRLEALARLGALAKPAQDAQAAIRQATAASSAALGKAQQALSGLGSLRLDAVEAANPLPELPVDYVPGMDPSELVEDVKVAPYPLPSFSGGLALDEFRTSPFTGSLSPVLPRDGPHAPPTGVGPLDDLAGQLVGVHAALEEALGGSDLSGLGAGLVPEDNPLGPLPVPGLPGGLPGPSLFPAQAQDANEAVDPDEAGAQAALGHAVRLLEGTEGVYAVTQPSLASILAGYRTLASDVDDLVEQARDATAQAETGIQAELEARLAAVEKAASDAQREASRVTAAHRQAVEAAAQDAKAALQEALDAKKASVQETLAADLAGLEALAAQAQESATARKQEVEAVVAAAAQELARLQSEAGLDAAPSIDAIRSAGATALGQVEADTVAGLQALQGAAAELQTRAESALRQLQGSFDAAVLAVEGAAADALAHADDVKAYAVGLARAQAAHAAALEQVAAEATLAKLPALEQARIDALVERGLELAGSTDGIRSSIGGLVVEVGDVTAAEVGKDIGYIAKVGRDYGKVPTGERAQKAAFWAGVVQDSTGRLADALDTAQELAQLAAQVEDAAADARSAIERMV